MGKLYAEDLGHYWKTSKTSSDDWIDKTIKLIRSSGGQVQGSYSGSDLAGGRSALMISFQFADDSFKIIWPVLPSRGKEDRAARVQAATLLYYDVKAKLLSAQILGFRTSFFSNILLPDGRTASEVVTPELTKVIPALFSGHMPVLNPGQDSIDGEWR
ncbi:MAG: hypothetical protein P4L50_25530 [Anaerolineaceae bacterium]|nr:hypothetical protein [Anaerolineaceae bacterium]